MLAGEFVADFVVALFRLHGNLLTLFCGSFGGILLVVVVEILLGGHRLKLGDMVDGEGGQALAFGLDRLDGDELARHDLHGRTERIGASEGDLHSQARLVAQQQQRRFLVLAEIALRLGRRLEGEAFEIGIFLVGVVENRGPDLVGSEFLDAQDVVGVVV